MRQRQRRISTRQRATLIACLVGLASWLCGAEPNMAAATAAAPGSAAPDSSAASEASKPDHRLREGEELAATAGTFRQTGDRVIFVSADGQYRLVVLENLVLDRVTRVLAEHTRPLPWKASGVITEYRGANYLLLSRAVQTTPEPAIAVP